MPRRITPGTSVDNLRQEAKRWLKALRASDPVALRRLRSALASPPPTPSLRDVQLALAREFGLPGWHELTRAVDAARATNASDDAQLTAPTVETYDAMALRLLEAYGTGTPEAMERHYADTWHRREWTAMRTYVLADLGIHRVADQPFPGITLDDARRWTANDHRFRSWDRLVEFVTQLPPEQRAVTRAPVGAACGDKPGSERFVARDWNRVIDAIESRGYSEVRANGQMTDAILTRLAPVPSVTALHLGGSKQLTDAGIAALAGMPQLRLLDIGGTGISDRGLAVLRDLPNLVTLKAGGTRITDRGAAELARCRALERVDLIWTATADGAIRALAGMPALRHLVTGSRVTDAGLVALHDIPAYRRWQDDPVSMELASPDVGPNMLVLRGAFTDRGMFSLTGLDGLFGLSVESAGVSARGLAPLISLPKLGRLSFDAHDDAMAVIARLPALRFLDVQDTDATDAGWAALAASRTIAGIWGRRCHGLGDRGFAALSGMPSLRNLAVSCRNVSDAAVALLPGFPALRELMPMDIPDEGYRHIARCENLETLTLMYCRDTGDRATELITPMRKLRKYFASHTRITDRSPECLGEIASLEEVELADCVGVTDAGIATLARLPRLRSLRLSGLPRVTAAVNAMFPEQVAVRYDGDE